MKIEELKTRVPIQRLLLHLGTSVPTRNWSGWQALKCPFHEDRDPSASVNLAAGRFTCHGCKVKGDVIDLAKIVIGSADTRRAIEWLEMRFA